MKHEISMRSKKIVSVETLFLLLALITLIRTAWISDDAAITIRSVLNFIHGFGPVYNIEERVQSFTHPLWFMLLSIGTFVFRNPFFVMFGMSIITTMITLWIFIKHISANTIGSILGVSILLLSRAFVDFSSSGLENPLSHLLILLIFIVGMDIYSDARISVTDNRLAWFFVMCSLRCCGRCFRFIIMAFFFQIQPMRS